MVKGEVKENHEEGGIGVGGGKGGGGGRRWSGGVEGRR